MKPTVVFQPKPKTTPTGPNPEKQPDLPVEVTSKPPAPEVAPVRQSLSFTRTVVAIPVAQDMVLTLASAVADATELRIEFSGGATTPATLIRKDSQSGLALLRITGPKLAYMNLGQPFAGGDLTCWSYPVVNIFNSFPDSINGKATAQKTGDWKLSLSRHPRLSGAAILDKSGALIGISTNDRETPIGVIPAIPVEQIRTFMAADAPKTVCVNPDPSNILQLHAVRD